MYAGGERGSCASDKSLLGAAEQPEQRREAVRSVRNCSVSRKGSCAVHVHVACGSLPRHPLEGGAAELPAEDACLRAFPSNYRLSLLVYRARPPRPNQQDSCALVRMFVN